ncbi:non-ribosomal peptide synthetase [Serratia symbiotica]|uniref:Non-ribosomal peptide synthetase n=1 Tax=Serratia symbiotica TaxID=138074 RepID=A0A068Z7T8_9GAMM|nr:non-ribosomal peptide synthetase [Serratia symbiotica]QLH62599.1 non-ribosomal peptide synthetase [Serratia symbiotica]CDS58290.1 Amino acid adenylation domain protein [Serratia symbiotica]
MKIFDFIAQLETQGIELWSEENNLRFRAPAGAMTESIKQELREHKSAILAWLQQQRAPAVLTANPDTRFDPFPLTQAQQAYFVGRHSAFTFGGVACRSYLEIVFHQPITHQQIAKAFNQLIARHDMLRVVIEEEGYQRVLPQVVTFSPQHHDWQEKSTTTVRVQLDELRDGMLAAPVDYHHWPLFSATSVQTAEQTRLLLAIELILVDSASLYLLVKELEQLLFEPYSLLPAPSLGFRDYVIAQRTIRQGIRYFQAQQYWRERLPDLPNAPLLPLASQEENARFMRRSFRLSHAQRVQLELLATAAQVTLNTLLLGAFAQVMGFYSEQRHFTLNLPIFHRDGQHPDLDRVVGDFTSITLLEVDLRGEADFGQQLTAINQRLFADLDHSLFSGLEVLSELSRHHGEVALMPIVFTSTLGQEERTGENAHYHIAQGLTQTPQVLIDCQVTAQPDGMILAWDSREAQFPQHFIEQAFTAFSEVIQRLFKEGERCLRQRQLLSLPLAQRQLRDKINSDAYPIKAQLLHQGVLQQAEFQPNATALWDNEGPMTYHDVAQQAYALAANLQHAGHVAGEPVAVIGDKGRAHALAPLAILLNGGYYVPIDPQQPARRREKILRNAGVRWAFCASAEQLPKGVVALSYSTETPAGHYQPQHTDVYQPAYIIYTSGSTGEPKGVVINHHAAWNTVVDINRRFAVSAQDRVLAVANLSFDLAVYDLFGVLAAGGTVIYPQEARKADPSHWAELITQHGVTLWNTVPAQLQMLTDAAQLLPSLRLAMVSGDWVPLDLLAQLKSIAHQAQLIALGGATEAAIWSVFHPVAEVASHWQSIPYGKPLANQQLHIVDEDLQDRPDWVSGEIAISGEGLADCYWQDKQKTAARFVERSNGQRLYLTGDRGRYWPDGNIEFLGRVDNQVKIRGHRVELGEIASVMRQHPAVADAAVLLSEGNGTASNLSAFAELASGVQPSAEQARQNAQQRARQIEQQIDGAAFRALMEGADRVAILAMSDRLRCDGLFTQAASRHSLEEIYQATGVAEVHQRLLRRWLDGLISVGALQQDEQGDYHSLIAADAERLQQCWQEVEQWEQRAGYGSQTLHYIRVCSHCLRGLLRGETDVRGILFPEGELSTAHAAYRDNLVSRSMNNIVIAAVTTLAAASHKPLRILEVGAGVAGTASDLVPALAEYRPEYWFTDLSEFFLMEARKLFAAYPWMHYGIFDMNEDAVKQGMEMNSFDVILCCNVLHNACNAGEVLAQFSSLLAPGGSLVFIEPFRRHNYPLLVSMEFFPELTGFTDLRATTDQTFFTREQWLRLLDEAGATLCDCAPVAESALASSGQGVFIAQFKTDRASLRTAELCDFLRDRLPGYMVPVHLQLLDRLPRTPNGKTDRQRLLSYVPQTLTNTENRQSGNAPRDALEQKIAEVWASVLDIAQVGRDADFYALGGDSLLLSRMIGRLRNQVEAAAHFEWETLLRHLLHHSTVMGLADLLRGAKQQKEDQQQAKALLVPLWGEQNYHTHCCVLLHAGTGNLQPYQHLLASLNKTPFARGVGLELPSPQAFMALAPHEALVTLAGHYADALAEQGENFTLMGYCFGGLLAAEIAGQLTERGKQVRELVVISSYQPPQVDDARLVDYIFARAIGADLEKLGLPQEPVLAAAVSTLLQRSPQRIAEDAFDHLAEHADVATALTRWMQQPEEKRLQALQAASMAQGVYHQQDETHPLFASRYALFGHSLASVGQYHPNPWLGKTIVLRNSESDPLLPGTPGDVHECWNALCLGELIVEDTPGDHFSCLSRHHAPVLAELIARHTVQAVVS